MNLIKTRSWAFLFISAMSFLAHAGHPSHSVKTLQEWKFQPVKPAPGVSQNFSLDTVRSLAEYSFPIELKLESDQFGAVIHQFQDWTSPAYFHAGLDIRALKNQEVFSPVFGHIEAGYYSYVDEPNGRSTKYFLPLKDVLQNQRVPSWGNLYFEVAVIDHQGYRFEMHHVDPQSLTPELTKKILNREAVAAGEFLGNLIDWPRTLVGLEFHHLHYNIISPEGLYLNPFRLSEKIEDLTPPEIVNVYATSKSRCGSGMPLLTKWTDNKNLTTQKYIVVETFDKINAGRFPQTPAEVTALFQGTDTFSWQFQQALATPAGILPSINEMYLYYYCDEKAFLQVASRSLRFYIKIPVPENYEGAVVVVAKDQVGNRTEKTVHLISE